MASIRTVIQAKTLNMYCVCIFVYIVLSWFVIHWHATTSQSVAKQNVNKRITLK